MKKGITLLLASLFLTSAAYACNCQCKCSDKQMMKKEMKKDMKKKMMEKSRPNNIDKNNVGITSGEEPDQTDPSLIEGNLENNDFKN